MRSRDSSSRGLRVVVSGSRGRAAADFGACAVAVDRSGCVAGWFAVRARHGLVLVVVVVAVVVAFVYLGPSVAFTVAARALIASIIYRLIRRVL